MASDSNGRGVNVAASYSVYRVNPAGSLTGTGGMQPEAAGQGRQPGRGGRGESGQARAERRATRPRTGRSSEEEEVAKCRLTEIIMHQRGDEEERGREQSRGGTRKEKREARSRRTASEGGGGGEQVEKLRWRLHQLERETLELTSGHNQELCRLQAELTRLRSAVERGEAQRVELQYELTVSRRDAERAARLTERAAELQQRADELQRALEITRQARDEDQHALQQELEERDRLIHSFSSENQRLHLLLQEQEEALEESDRRLAEVQREREKEAEEKRRHADELKYLTEREERSKREKEASAQRMKALESSVEAERAAHLESKFSCEVIQLRVRDLEAVLAVERSGQQEAQRSLEVLRAQLREVERAYGQERERSGSTERAQQRLQQQYERCQSDLSVALETQRKTTSELTEQLEEEKRRHADTHTALEQTAQKQADLEKVFMDIGETLQLHKTAAKPDGSWSPAEVLQLLTATLSACKDRQETTDRQLQDLLCVLERLQEENRTLQELTSDLSRQVQESQQASSKLEEEVARLRQEATDWSTRSQGLQADLEREREEKEKREREREREREEREREREREREEREREREEWGREREKEVQRITDVYQTESQARLSFLHCVYQRLLAGCVLLNQTQSILGNFTWQELCDVINKQVDQLTSDLRKANAKIAQLQRVCEKKSVCVRELQRSQECVLSRLEESVRRREEAWSSRHTQTVTQLQLCRSQADSLRDRASSLELHVSSLTSDLSRLQGLLGGSREESASLLSGCALLAGALRHAQRRLSALTTQKALLLRRLEAREELEEEVRRLAAALGGEEEQEEQEERGRRRRRVLRRWRSSVCAVLAARRWSALANHTAVLFQVEAGGGAGLVCGEEGDDGGGDEGRGGVCVRWLRSTRLCAAVLSAVADLQGALSPAPAGSAPLDVMSESRAALSRLLDHVLNQSDEASGPSHEDSLCGRLRLGLSRLTPPQPQTQQALVSTLQQHFLLFSQRLHSAEVERRSLRVEVSNLKRGLRTEKVPAQCFHSVCVELGQALSREQEVQTLLHTLQLRADTHTRAQSDATHTLSRTTQALTEAQEEVNRKERSLRILGKHLSGVQREKKQLEERLQRAEDELTDADRRREGLISCMKAAERSYQEVRESLVQSRRSPSNKLRPLLLPRELLELSGAESIMGAPEVAACQRLLSAASQLFHTCSSTIGWLEQEVSAQRGHVTALRSELQDVCLRDNQAFVPVSECPDAFPFTHSLSPAPSPSPKPPRTKTRERRAARKSRAGRRPTDRK